MPGLTELAEQVMLGHGWTTRQESAIAKEHLEFDLIAESEAAIVFFETTIDGSQLRRKAKALSAAVAAVTMQPGAGAKAWEAYLVLLVGGGLSPSEAGTAESVQRDLGYCRKVVLDGDAIEEAPDPRAAMDQALSFLFPLDTVITPAVRDVRSHLINWLDENGFDQDLAEALVSSFDSESDCRCWSRIKESVLTKGSA